MHKGRLGHWKGSLKLLEMIKRAVASGIYADYCLWIVGTQTCIYWKWMKLGLRTSRMVNNDKIWNFIGEKNLDGIYNKFKKLKTIKMVIWQR